MIKVNVKRGAGKCSQLCSILIIMAHHNDRFHLVWDSAVLFSDNTR